MTVLGGFPTSASVSLVKSIVTNPNTMHTTGHQMHQLHAPTVCLPPALRTREVELLATAANALDAGLSLSVACFSPAVSGHNAHSIHSLHSLHSLPNGLRQCRMNARDVKLLQLATDIPGELCSVTPANRHKDV
ncbi:hypothetical protein SARC_02811 [Sphaeroforma arctica JP610]|uniref:Uncharacterized protein n=1 Tax=Sphaeroforma arctica JP610 TaxID=667725 RepID=A0A0L0G7W9_9EUKA|nr:hypothetical protein SARC_02811 [Sphaeroforma arctica JP610]KNC84991.1 hypothetical protein SARC_02811 [Sphaeroforma arctica JP610]|eukprot:XP_014158893.1 hypothetical protein SARC_02811 [Sphaeroforma arctica JP610]